MHKKSVTLFVFGMLFLVSMGIWLLANVPFFHPLESLATFFTMPVQKMVFSIAHGGGDTEEVKKLQQENARLVKLLVDQKKLIADDTALRDQFKTNMPENRKLLPAEVIGAPGFIPAISQPESLIINAGKKQGVFVGQAVVVNNNLIGTVERVSFTMSVVIPIQYIKTPFPARSLDSNAVGLVGNTDAGGLQFGNVLLSETLRKDEYVVTKGDIQKDGKGFPPDIVIGKILAIDKKPSALFQSAKIISLTDISTLRTVFLVYP